MALDSAIGVISRWGSTSGNKSYVFGGKRDEIHQYLQAVDEVQRSINAVTASDRSRAKSAIQIAMPRLADEMRNILKVNVKSTPNPESSTYSSTMTDSASNSYEDDYVYGNILSVEAIDDLRSIAARMNCAGNLQDCKKAYITERKSSINASYERLKIKKLSGNDARMMEWKALEGIIKVWIKSAKICIRKIFAYEKQLCEKIFRGLGHDTDDACFMESVNNHATQLLDIAKTLSRIPKASERLFGILELYKTLFGLQPEIDKLFNTQSSESFTTKAAQILTELGGAISKTLSGFENNVLNADMSRHVPVDKIHYLSKYVMDYVPKLCQNRQTLMPLSLSNPPSISGAGMNFKIVEPQQPNELPVHVIWIIMCLVSKLEGEASSYKNDSASNFFLMNNFHYIVQKINGNSQVKELVGDDYFEKLSGKFYQAKAKYLRLTFAKVLSYLEKGSTRSGTSLSKSLKSFNAEFKKLQRNLAVLSVPGFQLLQDLRVSMEEMLVPAYTSFLEHLSSAPHLKKDVEFSAEQLKVAILDFFVNTQKTRPNK